MWEKRLGEGFLILLSFCRVCFQRAWISRVLLTKVDELSTATDRNYTYDVNGNLLSDDFRLMDGTTYGRSSYPYEVMRSSPNGNISYLYDGADQRIYKKVVTSDQTIQEMYIKDAQGRDLGIVKFTTDNSGTAQTKEYYVYGVDRIARVVKGSGSDARIYTNEATLFIYDHLGNTRVSYTLMNNAVPYIVNAMDYYPYGKILREFDNGAGDRYLTTAHERDKETGLDYRGARYYDSDVARFLSTDPWADKYPAWSTYNYVMGNPLRLIDPTGKGVDYTKEEALAKAARGITNGYKTEVVANPNKPDDYGVNYKRTVNGKEYEGVQYEGKFEGIVKGGLQKYSSGASGGFSNDTDFAAQLLTSMLQGAAQTVVDEGPHKYTEVPGIARDAHIPGAASITRLATAAGGIYSVGDKLLDTGGALAREDYGQASRDATVAAGYTAATIMMCAPTGVSQIAGGLMFIGFAIYDAFND